MKIELSATTGWLKITWSTYDASTEAEIVRRLGTVGAMGNGRRWFAPVAQLWTLTELFPKAAYSYEAMCACDNYVEPVIGDAPYPMAEPVYRKPKRGQAKPKAQHGELWR